MQITLDKKCMAELSELVATSVVKALTEQGIVGKVEKKEKTAYQKTEQLLYNYCGFKRIVDERMCEIEEIQKYGVPQSNSVKERVQGGSVDKGLVLPEESVESAVLRIEKSIATIKSTINMIDKSMKELESDPYIKIIPMKYFENRTMEDIGVEFGCDSSTVSRNKSRLVKEISLRLFPIQVIEEYMG